MPYHLCYKILEVTWRDKHVRFGLGWFVVNKEQFFNISSSNSQEQVTKCRLVQNLEQSECVATVWFYSKGEILEVTWRDKHVRVGLGWVGLGWIRNNFLTFPPQILRNKSLSVVLCKILNKQSLLQLCDSIVRVLRDSLHFTMFFILLYFPTSFVLSKDTTLHRPLHRHFIAYHICLLQSSLHICTSRLVKKLFFHSDVRNFEKWLLSSRCAAPRLGTTHLESPRAHSQSKVTSSTSTPYIKQFQLPTSPDVWKTTASLPTDSYDNAGNLYQKFMPSVGSLGSGGVGRGKDRIRPPAVRLVSYGRRSKPIYFSWRMDL